MATTKLQDIVEHLATDILETYGDLSREIQYPIPFDEASPGGIAFCNREGSELETLLEQTQATAVVCRPVDISKPISTCVLMTPKPRALFIDIMRAFFSPEKPVGIHPSAIIDKSTQLGNQVFVGANVTIGKGCVLGDNSVLHPNVCLYDNTIIGSNVVINANTVIGAAGFGYERNTEGQMIHFPHIGGVIIEDDVEIGSNVSIDRGTLGNTKVQRGAKIDNLVHIAHNVIVGEDSCVIALSMIGGSTQLGERSWVSPSACLRDGLQVGDDALIGLGAVVVKDVEPNTVVMGAPARPATDFKRQLKLLSELVKDKQ